MTAPVLAGYNARIVQLETEIRRASKTQKIILLLLACFFIAAAMFLGAATSSKSFLALYILILATGPALLARQFAANRGTWRRSSRLHGWYERAVARLDGTWRGAGDTGERFRDTEHVYERDLNILGNGSLFQLLCTVRTGVGRVHLARFLLDGADKAESQSRQTAVAELRANVQLREKAALLGAFEFRDSTPETFLEWVRNPARLTPMPIRILAGANAVFALGIVLCLIGTSLPRRSIVVFVPPAILCNAVIALAYAPGTSALKLATDRIGLEIGVFRAGIDLLHNQSFSSAKLLALQQTLSVGSQAVAQLERLTKLLEISDKAILFPLPMLLMLRTQVSFALEHWKHKHGASLPSWLSAWGEFEALLAVSGYAYEHPEDVLPTFCDGAPRFDARKLGHPLLPEESCIRNDVTLDSDLRFLIVSGSNMAGKSTLLRAIGLSVVLASAGAPVRAQSLILSDLTLCASLAIEDSILKGKSKFLAEVERLKQAIGLARRGAPLLFLIDEILSGTNSRDRREASESILRILLNHSVIGAISTHDLTLAAIADTKELRGANVHMGSRSETDPMDFDYLLKPGMSRETNALAIVRLIAS